MQTQRIKYIIKSRMMENSEPEYYAVASDNELWNVRKVLKEEMESFSIEMRIVSKRDEELEEKLRECRLGSKERRENLKEYYDRQPLVRIA